MFDLSPWKLLVLAVIALVVFGPNELPKMAAKAGTALRELRRIADGAKADLREGLGPEFADFDIDDLNPRLRPEASAQRPQRRNERPQRQRGHGQFPAEGRCPPPRRRTPLRQRGDLVRGTL